MKKLFFRLLLLQLPLLIFAIISLPALQLLYQSGELMEVDKVIKKNPVLYGPAYTQTDQEYKLKMLETMKHKDVLVVGGSRSMQFTEKMFNAEFYNAGGLILNFKDLAYAKGRILKLKPRVIILGCEQYFFNENFYLFNQLSDYTASENINLLNVLYHFDQDWFKGKISPFASVPDHQEALGLNAAFKRNGFRRDGSRNYSEVPETYRPYQELFSDINKRIRNKNYRYEKVGAVSKEALADLKKFLDACAKSDIKVIAYLPPWPPSTINMLKDDGAYEPYFTVLPGNLKKIVEAHSSFRFYDFTYGSALGASDEEFYDGHHASEKTYARMLKSMLEKDSSFNSIIDRSHIEEIIKSPQRFGLL